MPQLDLRLDPIVTDRVRSLSARDRETVRDNIEELRENPKLGHPSGLSCAKQGAWQHNCPHSFVVLYRWGADQSHPPDLVTIERIVDRYS